jgi:hypothetical protein
MAGWIAFVFAEASFDPARIGDAPGDAHPTRALCLKMRESLTSFDLAWARTTKPWPRQATVSIDCSASELDHPPAPTIAFITARSAKLALALATRGRAAARPINRVREKETQ